jgi:uncharacterized repeat protein (TIGR03803 family)
LDGNLWGTTNGGGTDGDGTVFNVTTKGKLTSVYSFKAGNDDGGPSYTVVQGQDGNMYGVSEEVYAGTYGSFFKLTAKGVITPHPFLAADGGNPNLPVQGSDGNFYGTMRTGGDPTCLCGSIYKATPAGKITVLHKFTGFDGAPYDGSTPYGTLVEGNDGNFYGTTYEGGNNGTLNGGIVFKITPGGDYTIIHSFDWNPGGTPPTNDGQNPESGLTLGSDGNFYGTTAHGGTPEGVDERAYGTIYQITPDGTETVLCSFLSATCTEAYSPTTPLVQHTNGKFYGNTSGSSLGGSVFYSIDVGLPPFVRQEIWSADVGAKTGILGHGFTGASEVTFSGGVAATFDIVSGTYLTATVPAGALSGPVTVTTPSGTFTVYRDFLVKPQFEDFAPPSGVVGATVTITGVSLTQTASVTIGGKAAAFTVISDTEVTATVPAGAKTGDAISLTTAGGTASSAAKFVVEPEVTSFSPKSGPVGTSVTINGHSFTGATAVTFGGVAASFTVVNDARVDAPVPPGAVTGPIAVTAPGGTGTSATKFTVK